MTIHRPPRPVRYVTATDWGISYSMPMGSSPDGPGTLHVSRPFPTARGYDVEYHPEHDGRSFDSAADKDAYCLKHGLIKVCTPPAPGKE